MTAPDQLLARLEAIGRVLSHTPGALALIGLGSVGLERERLDRYSDLDFYVIVEDGMAPRFIEKLDWLAAAAPIAYHFQNTEAGHKLLYADGIFCEFAVFDVSRVADIPIIAGQIVWQAAPNPVWSNAASLAARDEPTTEWLLGEALTNLTVGLGRERRGEHLSALRFIQGYAVDRLVQLIERQQSGSCIPRDPYTPERRFEQRFPEIAPLVADWTQGYRHNIPSALAILAHLEAHWEVNPALKAEILKLAQPD